MQIKLLNILACPACSGVLECATDDVDLKGDVRSGTLTCGSCQTSYPIRSSIPRFVNEGNYAASFGFQWNRFKFEQIDINNSAKLSEKRFYAETGGTPDEMRGKWILDAGCGAGRFLEVASRNSCEVVGVDISNAVDAAAVIIQKRPHVHLVQASIYELPFKPGIFDACYSIGVIQHTPDPAKAIGSLPYFLKAGGKIALTIYERKPWTLLNAKYLIRPLTKRMNKRLLLFLIQVLMPIFYPVTLILFHLPFLGKVFKFIIPIADYPLSSGLSWTQRYRCVVLDTFDMLSPQFDYPQTQEEVEAALARAGMIYINRPSSSIFTLIGERGQNDFSDKPSLQF